MESKQIEKRSRLVEPLRDHNGRVHFGEQPTILREVNNLDRHMFLVQFDDGATSFLFPHEVARYFLQRSRLFEQMRRAGNNLHRLFASEAVGSHRTESVLAHRDDVAP